MAPSPRPASTTDRSLLGGLILSSGLGLAVLLTLVGRPGTDVQRTQPMSPSLAQPAAPLPEWLAPQRPSVSAMVSARFPALEQSLAVSSSFASASWTIAGQDVAGLLADGQPQAPAGLKPAERQAWLAAAARAPQDQRLTQFFAQRYSDGTAVRFRGMDVWSVPLGGSASATAEDDGGRVVYRDAYPHTTVIHTAGPQRGEEFLHLADASAPTRFDYLLGTPGGDLRAATDAAGGLLLSDAAGHQLRIEAPWVVDATGTRHGTAAVRWELGRPTAAGQPVSLVLDARGLAYPLVIDPTWSTVGTLAESRYEHTATLLPNGKVLVAGGYKSTGSSNNLLDSCELFDPATGTWSATGSLATVRYKHSAVVLPDGDVLVTGGTAANDELYHPANGTWSTIGSSNLRFSQTLTLLPSGLVLSVGGDYALTSCKLFDPATHTWTATGPLNNGRMSHTATLLLNGKVLVAGGYVSSANFPMTSCELFDPANGTWAVTGTLSTARSGHTSTLLPSGSVLVTGGNPYSPIGTCEEYDPVTTTWSSTDSMPAEAALHTATLLPSGKVLVTGGVSGIGLTTACAIYDPAASGSKWSSTAALPTAVQEHTATLLPSGMVLVTGGQNSSGLSLATCAVIDPASPGWTTATAMSGERDRHTATLLPNGKVLVTGGVHWPGYGEDRADCEIYDPATGTWSAAASMNEARGDHTATLLPDGTVLVAGGGAFTGIASCELYDPGTDTWTYTTGPLNIRRFGHTATLLPTGEVLVTGGYSYDVSYHLSILPDCEAYDPVSGTWSVVDSLHGARGQHTATLLSNGKVLVVGGYSGGTLPSCERWDPSTRTWIATADLADSRFDHSATLLPSGKVLVAGGYAIGAPPVPPSSLPFNGGRTSCELYDPTLNTWTLTGNLSAGHVRHTAMALPSGKVLVTGGHLGSYSTAACELYDPVTPTYTVSFSPVAVTGAWSSLPAMAQKRSRHTATLLPSGQVLVAGGIDVYDNIFLTSCELLDLGLGNAPGDAPVITSIPSTLAIGATLALTGTGFTGASEASSGASTSSPTNYPLVQIQSAANGQQQWLAREDETSASATSVTLAAVSGMPYGPAFVRVFVNGIPSVAQPITLEGPTPQVISGFIAFAPHTYGEGAFDITGVTGGGSGNPVLFSSSATGVATVSGTTVTITGAGSAVITATQAGDATHWAATPVVQTLVVSKAGLVAIANTKVREYGAPNGTLSGLVLGVVGSDGIYATYSCAATATTPIGTYSIIDPLAVIPALVDPNGRLGNYNYSLINAALQVTYIAQAISGFGTFAAHTYGDAPIDLSAVTGGGSGNPVVFTSANPNVATVSGSTVTITGAGTVLISATQDGGTYHSAAPQVAKTLTVGEATLTIVADPASRDYGAANPAFTGTITGVVGSDNITATYASAADGTTAVGTYSSGANAITPTAVDPGGRLVNYLLTATPGTLTITHIPQAISGFAAFGAHTYGDAPITITGVTGGASGNPVVFSSSATGVATVSGSTVTIVGAGSTVITAHQDGDATHADGDATRTLTVDQAPLTAVADAASRRFGDPNPTFTGTLTGVVNGDDITATYVSLADSTTATGSYATGANAINPVLADPDSRLGNYALTATPGTLTITIPQVISGFAAFGTHTYGDAAIDLSGVTGGTSGNAVVFASSNTNVATVSGSTVTIVGAGSTDITATQAGSATYAAATPVVRTLSVGLAPLTAVADPGTKHYGEINPVFTGTLTGVVNGDVILAFYGSAANQTTPIGSYSTGPEAITPQMADPGARLGNYDLVYTLGTLTITEIPQTITFGAFGAHTYGDSAFTITGVTGGGSGNPVLFSSSATGVATVSGSTVTIVGAGTADITATQAGGGNYAAATPVVRTLTVTPKALTVYGDVMIRYVGDPLPALTFTSYGWVTGEGPGLFTGTTTTAAVAPLSAGVYNIDQGTLAATNYAITFVSGAIYVVVNSAPVVTVPAVQAITLGDGQVLAGSYSDADAAAYAQPVTTRWRLVSGPGTFAFATPGDRTTAVRFDRDGIYTMRLIADDGHATTSGTTTVIVSLPGTVVVDNAMAPTAIASFSTTGAWSTSSIKGLAGLATLYANHDKPAASWSATLPAGWYQVGFWKVSDGAAGTPTTATLRHADGDSPVLLDAAAVPAGWVDLGSVRSDGSAPLRLTATRTAGTLRIDAVRFIALPGEIIDRGLPGYAESGTWGTSATEKGLGTSATRFSKDPAATVSWTATTGGEGRVLIYRVATPLNDPAWSALLDAGGGPFSYAIAASTGAPGWADLGRHSVAAGDALVLSHASTKVLRADAVRFARDTVVDNGDPGYREEGGGWLNGNLANYGHSLRYSASKTAAVTWRASLAPGRYRVWRFRNVTNGSPTDVQVAITHDGSTDTTVDNLSTGSSGWSVIGEFQFSDGTGQVRATRGTPDAKPLRADAVRFEPIGDAVPVTNLSSGGPG